MRIASLMMTVPAILALWLTAPAARSEESAPVTREQASQLLDTLKDPAKREHFTATLEAYVRTLPTAAPAAPAPVSPGASPPPDAPVRKAHGASPLQRTFARLQSAGAHLMKDVRAVTDLPALSNWLGGRFDDPAEREGLVRGSLWITLILAVTIGVDWMLRGVIRRRVPAQAVVDASRPRHTFWRLAMYLGALAGAALAGNAAILCVSDLPVARTVAFGLVNTYVAVRLVLALLDEFVRTEEGAETGQGSPPLSAGTRSLLLAFMIAVALQLMSGEVADELGAAEDIQDSLQKCIALIAHTLAILLVLVSRRTVSAWIQRRSRPGSTWAAVTEALGAIWPWVAICAIAGSWLVWALEVPDAYRQIIRLIVATLAVLLVSRFISNLTLKALDRKMTAFSAAPSGSFGLRLSGYRNASRLVLQLVLVASTLIVLTEAWGLPSWTWFSDGHPGHRFAEFALQLLVLAIVGILCWEAADLAFERRVTSLTDASSLSRATRLRTLQPIIRLALLVVIALLVIMTALNAIGINVGPLLAGASIVGVALGFGSQKLVQDFITGIFLLVEDAVDVGDAVTLAGVSGTVEHISIRTIRLRAGDGSVHLIPFSAVTSVNNTNRGVGNAAVVVSVDPSEDTDRVGEILKEIALEMRQEPAFAASMQSDLQLWGVDKVDGSLATLAGQIVCTDTGRWAVQREFNRRLKKRFEREGVKFAIPQQGVRLAPAAAGESSGTPDRRGPIAS